MRISNFFFSLCLLILISNVMSAYDYSTSNVCDTGSIGKSQSQVAYMCNHQALGSCNLRQAAAEDGYDSFAEYGFGGYGSDPKGSCCRCFQVQIQDGDAPAKDLIVQGINTGGDVTGNQIDLSMIAGGFGANNGCANKVYAWNGNTWDGRAGAAQYSTSKAGDWCSDPNSDNTKCNNNYAGGIRKRADCLKLPTAELDYLCQYSFDSKWRIESTGLRSTLMKEVRCPAGLRKLSGCDREDTTLPLPSGKLTAKTPGVHEGKLTTMWDCCKPSCSWTGNVSNSKGTAVMSCNASGSVLGLGKKLECKTLTCNASCKTCSVSYDDKKCTSCNSGYYLSANPGSCIKCPSSLNCSKCSNSTTCTTCKSGYYKKSDGTCAKCSSNCSVCTSSTQCTTCINNTVLVGGVCK